MHINKLNVLLIALFFTLSINSVYAKKGKASKLSSMPVPQKTVLSEEDKNLFDYYFYAALNAKTLEKYDSELDLLNHCYAIDSTNANLLYELGNLYVVLQDKETAIEYLQKAVKYSPVNYYYNMAYGSMTLEMQQFATAVDVFKNLVEEYPDKADLYLYLSESYRLNNDIPNSIKALNELETLVGLNERISFQKFQLYSLIDKKKEAYAEMQKYIEKYPTEIKYYILLGNLYLYDNKNKEALESYQKAKEIDADDPLLTISLVGYYEKTGDKTSAEKEIQSALFNSQIDMDTKLGMLGQYVNTLQQNDNNTLRANILFDSLLVVNPQEARLNLMYGNLLMLQEKKDEARFQFRIYSESEPSSPLGWEQLLKTVFPDSIAESIKVCEEAISYIPDNPIFYFYLGISQYLDKNYSKALEVMNVGVTKVKDNQMLMSEFYGQMGDIYHQTNKQDSAFVNYDKALKYNPRNLGVLNNYSYYLSLEKKDLDKAEKMSAITIKEEATNPTYLDTYGWILYEQGAYPMAKIYLSNAVKYSEEKNQPSADIYEHYGDVLYKLNEKDSALEYWIKAKDVKIKEDAEADTKILDKKIETKNLIVE